MDSNEVVPDVIDVVPENIMEVKYGGNKVDMGNELTPTQVQNPPTHLSWPADEGALYTLLVTDPDAPSRNDPKFREWHHWLVVNIPGSDVSKGDAVAEYIGAGPPKGTGLHRYVFLAYKQTGKVNFSDPHRTNRSADGRGGQKTRDLVKKYNLGKPVAGNLFQAQWDDYVPKLYEQLSGK